MAAARKTVLITGAAGGIGAALAEEFQKKGYHVFATARTPSKIPQSVVDAPNVTVLTLDVVSSESIAAAVESVSKETGGKLDVLVNNSASMIILPALDTPIEEGKKLFDLNFWAVLAMIQAFTPLLIKTKGCVVNHASSAGTLPLVYQSMYNASKAALLIGSETWRLELAPLGIRTLTLPTGAVKTQWFSNLNPMPLPENSYYSGIQDFLQDKADGKVLTGGISPEECAIGIVREVERGTTGKYWVGGGVMLIRFVNWALPQWITDKILENMSPVSGRIANDLKDKKV